MLNIINAALSRLADWAEGRRWLDTPNGCCQCGTGGPYYKGDKKPVVRYLYGDATAFGDGTRGDWSSCSAHPLAGVTPVVDYGRDVQVTFRQAEADFAAALAAREG